MASAAEPSRSTRPLPTGWSDSSGDDLNAKGDRAMNVEGAGGGGGGGGGGGFDTDSSGEGWCGRGGGLRDFERASAENTRRALLRNDAQLCEPPPLPPPDDHQQQQQRREPPLRFVPGDPFAKEEADVGAWARHFTYLAVAPSGTIFSKTLEPPGSAETETERGAGAGTEVEVAVEAGLRSRFGEKGGAAVSSSTVAVPAAAGRAAALVSPVAAAAAASTQGGEEEEEGDDDEENERRQEGQGREGGVLEEKEEEEEEAEVVYASHGVYEEYLAYDCRPPGSDEIDGSPGLVAEEGADSAATTSAAAAAAVREGQGRWPNATQKGDCGASRPRLGTPQRELRQEIMDRLFDEVWERLTPDLVLLLELEASAGAGGGGSAGQPGERQRPEALVGDGGGGGGGGGGGAGARAPVVGGGNGGFATKFGRNDESGFRRDSMEK